jgi:hypothetical protein
MQSRNTGTIRFAIDTCCLFARTRLYLEERDVMTAFVSLSVVVLLCIANGYGEEALMSLDSPRGLLVEAQPFSLTFLGMAGAQAASFRFAGQEPMRIASYEVLESRNGLCELRFILDSPGAVRITGTCTATLQQANGRTDIVVRMVLSFPHAVSEDLEVVLPFRWEGPLEGETSSVTCPLYNGWARDFALDAALRAEWRLGNWMSGADAVQLALPVIHLNMGTGHASVAADPTFSSLFELQRKERGVQGHIRYRYLGSKVPLTGEETRTFAFSVGAGKAGIESALDAFFSTLLADVPAGPAWLHDIAMVYYNYLADGGKGWDNDVQELARTLSPEERRRVALCFHGWYDGIGSYAFDQDSGQMKEEWVAMPRTRAVHFTRAEVAETLRKTRALGFRVLWYFGDGLVQDSGGPNYHPDWNLLDANGKAPRPCWTGPDTSGETFPRNPAHPEVAQWYQDYLAALLKAYGTVVDGFVWDETYYVRSGDIALKPFPAYCARAMMNLVKTLTAQVHAFDSEKVFLSSDNARILILSAQVEA